MKIFLVSTACAFLFGLQAHGQMPRQNIDLSGKWGFALDPKDEGIAQQWFRKQLPDIIQLPGSLQEQGFGEDITAHTQWTMMPSDSSWFKAKKYEKYRKQGNVKVPFCLQPQKHYVGVAWYQKEITFPKKQKGQWVELQLERAHWETTLFVNDKEIGKNNALQTPHRYRLDATGKVLVSIRVDNRVHIPVGIAAHSVSDHTQTNWNGIVGNITLRTRPSLYIEDVRVYPDLKNRKAKVVVSISGNSSDKTAQITLKAKSSNSTTNVEIEAKSSPFDSKEQAVTMYIELGDKMLTWSEFEPNLYLLEVALTSKKDSDLYKTTFGMREFKAQGTRFSINGSPTFLRGTLECAIFPLTGYPSMSATYWEKIYKRCKEFGLNHIRFHSWCPPEVAFEVADRQGIYLQVECGGWTDVGSGKTSDQWFYDESERIVKEYGNHPSFCLMAYGNEPDGSKQVEYLSTFVDHWKAKDSRRVYTSAAGWPYTPNSDYYSAPNPRIQGWGDGLKSIINAEPPKTDYDFRKIIQDKKMPVVSHEIGQWCVYPNFKEMDKYTGVLKPKNFEIFKETLAEHHMNDLSEPFLYASGRLQTLCYKADIEAALRTPGFAGFQLLDIHDFPGQGTALVGVLDIFWDTKGYVDGKTYSSFCNRTVPLARIPKLTWTNDETFRASIEVSHFGKQAITNASVQWSIIGPLGKVLKTATSTKTIPIDNCVYISDIEYSLSSIRKPMPLKLMASISWIEEGQKQSVTNTWDFWTYPSIIQDIPKKPYITSSYEEAVAKAKAGANVLYCLPKGALRPEKGGDIAVGFSSIFWNTSWTNKQAPHTLGIYCDPKHSSLELFPNNGYSDYQWWDIVTYSQAMVLDDFPATFRPIIHLIDDWFTNRKLGILLETKVGKGKMVICSVDLATDIDKRIATRQFKHSIKQYMASDKFNPSAELDLTVLKALLK